jgi:predicted RNase H-like nuclease (RuvC/YqgF family)
VKERRLSPEDPVIMDIVQRVTRLEEKVSGLERLLSLLKEKIESVEAGVEKIDQRTWYIVTGIVLSILIQVLFAVLPR